MGLSIIWYSRFWGSGSHSQPTGKLFSSRYFNINFSHWPSLMDVYEAISNVYSMCENSLH